MSSTGTAVAGWYPDPSNPSQLRYWDGQAWTANTTPDPAQAAPVPPAPSPPPGSGPGPYGASGPGIGPYGGPAAGWSPGPYGAQTPGAGPYQVGPAGSGGPALSDIGSWLGETFRSLFARIVPVALLLFVVPAVGFGLATYVGLGSITGLTYDRPSRRLFGAEGGPVALAALIVLVTLVLGVCGYLATFHQLYWSQVGRPSSLGRSLAVGVKRFPRAVFWVIVYVLLVAVVAGVLYAAPFALYIATDKAGFLALYLATIPVLLMVSLWLGTRLIFLWTGVALSPTGTGPWSTSLRLTRNRFWPVLGRILLLVVMAAVLASIIQFALQLAFQLSFIQLVKTDPVSGDVIINGHDVSRESVVRIGTLLPSRVGLAIGFGAYALAQSLSQSVIIAGTTSLYRQLQGPTDEG